MPTHAAAAEGADARGGVRRGAGVSGLEAGLRRAVLTLVLVLSCLLGFLSSYLLLVLGVAIAGLLAWEKGLRLDGTGRTFAAAFVALAAVFAIDAQQPADLIYGLNFVSLLLYAPLASLLRRGAAAGNAARVADLALAGTAAGFAFALVDGLVVGHARAGSLTTDPIRLADTALILGFLALMGVIEVRGARRWLYLLGPALALATTFLSGSRGALLAFGPLALAAMFFLVRRKLLALALSAGAVAALVAVIGWTDLLGARAATFVTVIGDVLSGTPLADEEARIRLELYKAGWAAFQQSPLLGHGWAGMMPSVAPFLSDADKVQTTLPHLHNEALTLAVAAGVVGIAAYLVLLALPLAACLRTPRDGLYRARLFGTMTLVLSYFMLGLPDTMLAFELHTALYVAFTAILLGYCRDRTP